MVSIYLIFYGLFDAVTGDFLNVYILRIPENQDFVTGCPHCSAYGCVLAFYDVVPVLSWLFLKGRYWYCGAPISIQYPVVEPLTTPAFILRLLSKRPGMSSAIMCMFPDILITAVFIDTRRMYMPNGIHALISLLSCVLLTAGSASSLIDRPDSSPLIGSFPALVDLLSRDGIGWGNVKLLAAGSLLIGAVPVITIFLVSYVITGPWCAVPFLWGRIGRKTRIPMAPFFAVPLVICGLQFRQLLLWYLDFSH